MSRAYVDAGELNQRVAVLELAEDPEGVFAWRTARNTWAKAKPSAKHCVWSAHGIGAAGVTFVLRRQPLSLGHALWWQNQHCFITCILPFGTEHVEVGAALVEISECRYGELTFPGSVTEKYLRHDQLEPMAVNDLRHVLVTPKAIALTPGHLVEIEGVEWPILVAHTLDPWHNEYEIERRVDL